MTRDGPEPTHSKRAEGAKGARRKRGKGKVGGALGGPKQRGAENPQADMKTPSRDGRQVRTEKRTV